VTRVAAIDIGTNTALLVIAERDADGGVRPVVERATITRLGEGVDRTRQLLDTATERTLACLRTYADLIREAGAERVAAVGTSALRDASGGQAFLARAEQILGVRPRVVAGDEEAELTFRGALSGLKVAGEVVVFDIGGGSTEIVVGHTGPPARLTWTVSLDVGSVRLFERRVKSDPPSAEELAAAQADVREALAALAPAPKGATLVGVAGTVTTLAAIEKRMAVYEPATIHGSTLRKAAVEAELARLGRMRLEERRATPGLEPGRADVIVVGAVLVLEVLAWARADVLIASDRGVRWGLVEALLA
jgi:exopolyphosphatase/guanosine-5'-triphosphate,3'-diphosphate pyrophosphatase